MMTNSHTRELLNDGQREALCNLLRSFRRGGKGGPDWDMAGIRAAVTKAEGVADSGVQLAAAALAAAANPAYRTPGLISKPGKHWPAVDGERRQPTRAQTDVPCPDHEGQTMPCPACRAVSRPPTPTDIAAMRAALTAPRTEEP